MDVEQVTIETTIEAAARPPIGAVSADTMMITATVITEVMTAMDIAVMAATVAAEEAFTSVV
jgi:hypothetical protein